MQAPPLLFLARLRLRQAGGRAERGQGGGNTTFSNRSASHPPGAPRRLPPVKGGVGSHPSRGIAPIAPVKGQAQSRCMDRLAHWTDGA
jgi:hypothetical protein